MTATIERNVILLRKLPAEIQPSKVQVWLGDLLGDLTANLITITRELSNVWTLTFKSEADAHSAWLVLQVASFEGERIIAEIRSDTLLRSF